MTEDLQPEKRGPGRPPKADSDVAPVKKGKPTWKPANVDEVFDKQPGYRYRWARSDEDNIARKKAEQWEVDEGTTVEGGYGRIDEGKPLTSVRKRRDAILMKIPEEIALERDEYINNKTARQIAGLKKQTQKDSPHAPIHGSISMEKRGIRTIIKE